MSSTKEEGVKILEIPKRVQIDTASPMACLRSMGLLADVSVEGVDTQKIIDKIEANDSSVAAAIWTKVGGVRLAHLTDTLTIHGNGDVEGPAQAEYLQHAPATLCKTHDAKSGTDVMTLLAINKISKVADVCVYDPRKVAKEETLYSVAGSVGLWLRVLLGEGWGLRVEVYCDRYSPSEVPEFRNFWSILMVILKAYLPHVRMLDTQAALRVECMAAHTTIRDVLLQVLCNAERMLA